MALSLCDSSSCWSFSAVSSRLRKRSTSAVSSLLSSEMPWIWSKHRFRYFVVFTRPCKPHIMSFSRVQILRLVYDSIQGALLPALLRWVVSLPAPLSASPHRWRSLRGRRNGLHIHGRRICVSGSVKRILGNSLLLLYLFLYYSSSSSFVWIWL
jgi:hypothetical protein